MFERGFKSWCEKRAVETRRELGLKQHEKLDPHALAAHLRIRVWGVEDVPGLSEQSKTMLLTDPGNSMWSAVTLVVNDRKLIILNSSHSSGRNSNNLMHELSHIVLGHSPGVLEVASNGLALRQNYDKQQEQEADWLAACLLLPRPALVRIKKSAQNIDDAATSYGVSRAMLSYRLAVTGVNTQFA